MSDNSTIPYLLQLKEAVNAIHLSENENSSVEIPRTVSIVETSSITLIPTYDVGIQQICVQPPEQIVQDNVDNTMEIESQDVAEVANTPANTELNFVYEIVYPEQLNLKPYNLKRGRPKNKKKMVEGPPVEGPPVEPPKPAKPGPRTRSGRLVKFPKYIEKDFKKVEIEDGPLENEEPEVKISEFIRFGDDNEQLKKNNELQLEFHQRRRKISSQYRCPKCNKAYLGKFRMVQHLKKYPDHGPLPNNELNFDVWNYLVDITQKCPPAQRGVKFCEELTNLLHNVLLLTSALFKKAELNKNNVDVDKVLGNAIGLPPGSYKFNDSELYKDVTVLKLITNSDFFKPISRDAVEVDSEKIAKDVSVGKKSEVVKSNERDSVINKSESKVKGEEVQNCKKDSKIDVNKYFNHQDEVGFSRNKSKTSTNQSDGIRCNVNPPANSFIKDNGNLDRLSVHADLLSENSLLNLPNLRNSVDDLIISGSHLLDNSTSSDEVMNVDQFVNERFKKITEPEIELTGGGLNLDLPSLDLFQFHGS